MTLRDRIVTEAREWIGTPYQHQVGVKGVAVDCIHLVIGVLQQICAVAPDWWQNEGAAYAAYGRTSGADIMRTAMRKHLREIDVADAQPGDVVYMSFGDGLHHAGFLADYRHGGLSIIHALSRAEKVTEHRLDATWRGYIKAAFAVPEVC
jgi:NlpC/P60 family putative phage cell wall peptidase